MGVGVPGGRKRTAVGAGAAPGRVRCAGPSPRDAGGLRLGVGGLGPVGGRCGGRDGGRPGPRSEPPNHAGHSIADPVPGVGRLGRAGDVQGGRDEAAEDQPGQRVDVVDLDQPVGVQVGQQALDEADLVTLAHVPPTRETEGEGSLEKADPLVDRVKAAVQKGVQASQGGVPRRSPRRRGPQARLGDGGHRLGLEFRQDGLEQGLLVSEVVVYRTFGEPGVARDVVQRGGGEALGGEAEPGAVEEGPVAGLRILFAPGAHRHHGARYF